MPVTSIGAAPAYNPRFGHAPPRRPVMFGLQENPGKTATGSKSDIARRAKPAQRATLTEIFGGKIAPNRAYAIDTVKHPELLNRTGALLTSMAVIKAARPHLGDPARGTLYVLADYPNDEMVTLAQTTVANFNRLTKPKGFMDKLMATSFRAIAGIQTPMKPVEFVVNPDNPLQGAFRIPVPEMSGEDIDRLLGMMGKMPPALLGLLGKMGM